MCEKTGVTCIENKEENTVIVENPHYRMVLGKDTGGFIRYLSVKTGQKTEPLAANRIFITSPIKASDPSKLLLEVMNIRLEDWIQVQPESFSKLEKTCEKSNGKLALRFKGVIKPENIPEKPEIKYLLEYTLDNSELIEVRMHFCKSSADSEFSPIIVSLEFFDLGRWIVNAAEDVLSEDFVVRHPLRKSFYSEHTDFLISDRFWMSPLYPLSFNIPVLGIEKKNKTCSALLGDMEGSSRGSRSAFYLETDKLKNEWVLCFRTLLIDSEAKYALLLQPKPLGEIEDIRKIGRTFTQTFNYQEPLIKVSGPNYIIENQHLKLALARNRGGCIRGVSVKSGSKYERSILGSNLIVAEGIYDRRFFFTILGIDNHVDASKCLTPFITQERKENRLAVSFNGYLSTVGPAEFSVPKQKIQYYLKYELGSSRELNITAGIKPHFEPTLEGGLFEKMVADWLGFTPDYKALFEKSSILLQLDLSAVERYVIKDDEGSVLSLRAEGKGKKTTVPEGRLVRHIDIWHKSRSITRFTPSFVHPQTFKPKIYVLDGEKFSVCFAWLDQEPYILKKNTWYEIGFKASFRAAGN